MSAKTKLNTDLDREEKYLQEITHANDVLNSGSRAAKSPKKVLQDEDADVELDDDIILEAEEDQTDDDSSFTMGEIVSEENSGPEDSEEIQILKSATKKIPNDEDEGTETVWVDEFDIFNDKDEFLDDEDYDPEEDYYDGD